MTPSVTSPVEQTRDEESGNIPGEAAISSNSSARRFRGDTPDVDALEEREDEEYDDNIEDDVDISDAFLAEEK